MDVFHRVSFFGQRACVATRCVWHQQADLWRIVAVSQSPTAIQSPPSKLFVHQKRSNGWPWSIPAAKRLPGSGYNNSAEYKPLLRHRLAGGQHCARALSQTRRNTLSHALSPSKSHLKLEKITWCRVDPRLLLFFDWPLGDWPLVDWPLGDLHCETSGFCKSNQG